MLDPDVIVLGGGLSDRLPRSIARCRRAGAHYVFSDSVVTRLRAAALGRFERRARRRLAVVGTTRSLGRNTMALTRVLKFDEIAERRMPNGATIRPLVDKESCNARIKTNTVSFPAGHAVEFHRHNCNEMIVVLAGDCAVEIDGSAPVNLKPFDTVSVETGTWHRFLSTGDTGFTLLAIYDAERVERTLRDSGKTTID